MERPRTRRSVRMRTVALVVTVAVAAISEVFVPPAGISTAQTSRQSVLADAACALPGEQILRVWRGTRYDRSGDIQYVPREPNFLGGGLPHAGPWDYTSWVPVFWYGPGYIRATGRIREPGTTADIAPTQAELLGYKDFHAPDGKPMMEALVPKPQRREPPQLIITLVWDAGGRGVLDTWPDSWPNLRRLIPEGTWYDFSVVGSSPTDTPPIHATMGTGAFPVHHGLLDQKQRMGDEMVTPWGHGPTLMLLPTLADLYDLSMNNKPLIGAIASLGAHLGMIGHGAMWGGGDRDLAINRESTGDEGAEAFKWNLRKTIQPYFKFPNYVNDLPTLKKYLPKADAMDGSVDGAWRGHSFKSDPQIRGGFDSPARIPWQTSMVEQVVKREGFGEDKIPDLLYLNYKAIDNISHSYSVNSVEMQDTVRTQDADLKTLIKFLDKEVGQEKWVMVITADHGAQFDPAISGAFPISPEQFRLNLTAAFDDSDSTPVVLEARPTQVWLNTDELKRNGYTLSDVSVHIMNLTKSDFISEVPVAASEAGERLFDAAFPTEIIDKLPCLSPRT
ncbi:MAG: alkaline phosphatase family protein [Actinomycetota bacterium]